MLGLPKVAPRCLYPVNPSSKAVLSLTCWDPLNVSLLPAPSDPPLGCSALRDMLGWQVLEWDRHYLTLLGVSNNRLYQMRAQVPERLLDSEFPQLRQILNSFQAFEILAV